LIHPLDNPVWMALTTAQRDFGQGDLLARRYRDHLFPIAALSDWRNPACWKSLEDLLDANTSVAIFAPELEVPSGWNVELRIEFVQMTGDKNSFVARSDKVAPFSLRDLTVSDAQNMSALASLSHIGPVGRLATTSGRYVGAFNESGTLISMAGERMRLDRHIEVGSVCTSPAYQGKGAATCLVYAVTKGIVDRGSSAFLHVEHSNATAIAMYKKLGFQARTRIVLTLISRS
jgi:ribosomal protein S18 acetylase RimI-like enzyme